MAKDNNQDVMNLTLLGAAAWVAYNYFFQSPNPQTVAGTQTAGTVGNTGQPGAGQSQSQPQPQPLPIIPPPANATPQQAQQWIASQLQTQQPADDAKTSITKLTTPPTTGGSGSGVNAALQAAAAQSGDRYNLDQWAWIAQNAAGKSLGVDAYFTTDAMIGRQNQTTLSTWLSTGGNAYLSALTGGMNGLAGYISNFSPTPARIPVDIASNAMASSWAE